MRLLLFSCLLAGGVCLAEDLDRIRETGEQKVGEGAASQQTIDRIVEGTQQRLARYRSLMKQIEGLEVYNRQLSAQIGSQQILLDRLQSALSEVASIERQMNPLLSRMAASLEAFIELDMPFHRAERRERLAYLLDEERIAEVDLAERFRQIMEAYRIENEYGRKLDVWQDIIQLGGVEREVDVLRVGRIAMVCQTRDAGLTARWDQQTRTWQLLDAAIYRNSVRNAIRMARKQVPVDITLLPISAPEVVRE